MKIYTRTGDAGDTGLFGGGRVAKDHPRVTAYGSVDELNAAVGLARAAPPAELFDLELTAVQRDLFALGGQLAAPDPDKVRAALAKAGLGEDRVRALEQAMDTADPELPPLRAFVLPAGAPKAAALHLARTICRRAERSVVTLARGESVPPLFLVYLNRLSDYLFVLARLANHRAGQPDVLW
jgi:cob(I)alamin adenosyltransferase